MAANEKISIKFLIHLIGERPALWDKTSETYKDRALRETSWREICSFVNENFNDLNPDEKTAFTTMITKKWTNIRSAWVNSMKYGFDEETFLPAKPYVYHEQLKFLHKIITCPTRGYGNREPAQKMSGYNEFKLERMLGEVETCMDPECNNETFNTKINQFKHSDGSDNGDGEGDSDWLGENISKPAAEIEKQSNPSQHEDQNNTNLTDVRPKSSKSLAAPQKTPVRHGCHHRNFNDNRHWNFFKGIFPSLNTLDDDHTLQFQAEVIGVVQRLKANQKLSAKPLKKKKGRNYMDIRKMNAGKPYATRAAKHSINPLAEGTDDEEEEEQNSNSDSNWEGD